MLCRALPLFELDNGLALVMNRLKLFENLTNEDGGILYHPLKDTNKGVDQALGGLDISCEMDQEPDEAWFGIIQLNSHVPTGIRTLVPVREDLRPYKLELNGKANTYWVSLGASWGIGTRGASGRDVSNVFTSTFTIVLKESAATPPACSALRMP